MLAVNTCVSFFISVFTVYRIDSGREYFTGLDPFDEHSFIAIPSDQSKRLNTLGYDHAYLSFISIILLEWTEALYSSPTALPMYTVMLSPQLSFCGLVIQVYSAPRRSALKKVPATRPGQYGVIICCKRTTLL